MVGRRSDCMINSDVIDTYVPVLVILRACAYTTGNILYVIIPSELGRETHSSCDLHFSLLELS